MRKKYSIIWLISKNEFEKIVGHAKSFSDIIRYFGLSDCSGTRKIIKERCNIDNISTSHFSNTKRLSSFTCIPIDQLLHNESKYARSTVKRRIIKEKLLENKCNICGISDWRDKSLCLILDHKNGISNDHRLKIYNLFVQIVIVNWILFQEKIKYA